MKQVPHRDPAECLVLEECELFGELGGLEVVEDERDATSGGRRAVSTEHSAAAGRLTHRQVTHPVVRRPTCKVHLSPL